MSDAMTSAAIALFLAAALGWTFYEAWQAWRARSPSAGYPLTFGTVVGFVAAHALIAAATVVTALAVVAVIIAMRFGLGYLLGPYGVAALGGALYAYWVWTRWKAR